MSEPVTMYYPMCLQGTFPDLAALCAFLGLGERAHAEIEAAAGETAPDGRAALVLDPRPLGNEADKMRAIVERGADGRLLLWVGLFAGLTPDASVAEQFAQGLEQVSGKPCAVGECRILGAAASGALQ